MSYVELIYYEIDNNKNFNQKKIKSDGGEYHKYTTIHHD